MDRGVCKGCGAAILWVKNAQGKPVPFDAKVTQFLLATEEGFANGHINHFITCDQRDKFRKKEPQP